MRTDHEAISIDAGFELDRLFNGFELNDGKTLADVPDTVVFRLKNLIAIDAEGNDLHIGAATLKVPHYLITASEDVQQDRVVVYPNPTTDILYVTGDQLQQGTLYSSMGNIIRSFTADEFGQPIDISSLVQGVYYLQLETMQSAIKVIKL